MTLHSLNYATNLPSQSDPENPQYQVYPDGIEYGEDLDPGAKYETGELDDEFVASGWTPPSVTESGGTPVRFD